MTRPTRTFEELLAFVRTRTAPAPVPLAPEIRVHQASELTSLWHATAGELAGWDDSPFWAFPWAGGQALARYVLDAPEVVRGRRVVDFATGSGVVAIAALRAGAAEAIACDLDPFCAAAVHANAALNGVTVPFRAGDAIGEPLDGAEVLLAGDVFYERSLAARSFAWFRALATRGVRVLAGDAGRTYAPVDGFVVRATYDVPTTIEIEAAPIRRARVLEIVA
jgi:predicted nicotinamide N-methyase